MSAAPNPQRKKKGTRPPTLPVDNPPSFIETTTKRAAREPAHARSRLALQRRSSDVRGDDGGLRQHSRG